MDTQNIITSPTQQEKFWVLLQEGRFKGCNYHSLIVSADGPSAAFEKALGNKIAKDYPNAVYWESADNVRHDIHALRHALGVAPAKQGFWCLVQDESDNTFVGVNVTVNAWHQADEAAVESRKTDFGLTREGDAGFPCLKSGAFRRLLSVL